MARTTVVTPVRVAWAGIISALALTLALASVALSQAQPDLGRPEAPRPDARAPRARILLKTAIESYKRGDYDIAATYLQQAEAGKNELTLAEQQDLARFAQQTGVALQARKDGAQQLRLAEDAARKNKLQEAGNLARKVNSNQYLSGPDRQALAGLNEHLRKAGIDMAADAGPAAGEQPKDVKALLNAARAAGQRGDFGEAESLIVQAEKVGYSLPTWMHPWSDTPSKARRDIAGMAKGKAGPPPPMPKVDPVAKVDPQKKDESSGGPLGFVNKLFSKSDKQETPAKGPDGKQDPKGPLAKGPDFKLDSKGPMPKGPDSKGPLAKGQEPKLPPFATIDPKTPAGAAPPPAKKDGSNPFPSAAAPKKDGPPSASAPGGPNKTQARQIIEEGYRALDAGDLKRAQAMAQQARDLRPDLEWWEKNPDRLMADIQRRAQGEAITAKSAVPPPGAGPVEARALVKEARGLFVQDKIEEAERKCTQAAAIQGVRWGLFEDNPDKVRGDINKVRSRRDKDDSVRLLAEARKAFQLGQLQEAKAKAWQAQQKHGPYGVLELGDRPDKLLQEIQRAEAKGPVTPADPVRVADAGTKKGEKAPPANNNQVAQNTKPPVGTPKKGDRIDPAPLPSRPLVSAATRQQAIQLLDEARILQKQGKLLDARQKAIEAKNLGVPFGPEEDSPEFALLGMAAQCDRVIQQHLQQAGDHVTMTPNDPQRYVRANQELQAASQLAKAFSMDHGRIDQKAQWLVQASRGSNVPAPVVPPKEQPKFDIITAQATMPPPPTIGQLTNQQPSGQPAAMEDPERNRQRGLQMLEQARMELKAGNTKVAAALAEDAFQPRFGVQKEAADVLRSVMAEEHNQHLLNAERNALAGIDAFNRHDFKQAATILASVDMRLVSPQTSGRIRNIMSMSEMQPGAQPGALNQVVNRLPLSATPIADQGRANVTDKAPTAPAGDLMDKVHALEQVQLAKLKASALAAERSAIDLVKRNQHIRAMDELKNCLEELNRSELDPAKLAPVRAQLEEKLQRVRTFQAQKLLENQSSNLVAGMNHDEGASNRKKAKTQEEVRQLIDQYRAFQKEGKYKDAEMCALKAAELDPDNVAVQAAIRIAEIHRVQRKWDENKARNEEYFRDELSNNIGPYASMQDPVRFDKNAIERNRNRANGKDGFSNIKKSPYERMIEQKLLQPQSINFKDTPLSQVISDLNGLAGINIVADKLALDTNGISLDMPLTLSVDNIPLKSALNILLRQARLVYIVKEDVLQITTEDNAKGRMQQKVYPVTDLVIPVDNHAVPTEFSFRDAMARHIAGTSGSFIQSPSPFLNPLALQQGTPVSSSSSGLGGAMSNNPAAFQAPQPTAAPLPGKTLENVLIDMIQNSVAPHTWSQSGGPATIHYYPLGHALVINQSQEVQEDVAALLASLRRLQDLEVAIEMKLVSVSEAFFERIGLDFDVNIRTGTARREPDLLTSNFTPFGFVNRNFDRLGLVSGLTPAGTLTPDLNIPLRFSSFDFNVPPFGGYPGTLGADGGLSLGLAFLSDIQVFMFLEAAQGDRRTNVMQAPKITVFNGQTAFITVQDQQFFLTGVTLNQAGSQIFFQPQNQPFNLGVALQVTPVVSADRRFVRLNLTPNLTNLASATVPLIPVQIPVTTTLDGPGAGGATNVGQPVIFQMFFQQPTFTNISLSTTVNVPDGGTVLLGGLKTLSEARNEFGPPILSKIPYLSRLFKNVGYGRESQSLMIMVTPRIIINEEEERIFLGEIPPIPRP